MKVCILKNEDPVSHTKWELSCKKLGLEYTIIDLTAFDWYEKVRQDECDFFVLKPPGETFKYKNLYDERLFVISKGLNRMTYPSYEEVLIYENKRMLSAFLKGAKIPMPDTFVFYSKIEAVSFAKTCRLPIVGKTGIGASGTGVRIIKSNKELLSYINQAFGKGIKRRLGPNRNTGNLKSWTKKALKSPQFFLKKVRKYIEIYTDAQKGFIILQEYTHHEFEWRIVKIGESWFGHQKIKEGEKASGTKGIDYIAPSINLLNFCKGICDSQNFNSMALDIFEHPTKGYVINELQTIFGHVQDYIMEVNGKIGRYRYLNNQWIFEEGDYNTNESYDLRLKHAIELFQENAK